VVKYELKKFFDNRDKCESKKRPSLLVYRECQQRLGKLKDHASLDKFNTIVANYQHIENLNLKGLDQLIKS